jgi:hypothetical protein
MDGNGMIDELDTNKDGVLSFEVIKIYALFRMVIVRQNHTCQEYSAQYKAQVIPDDDEDDEFGDTNETSTASDSKPSPPSAADFVDTSGADEL